jgi:hypothetical protein
MSPLHALVHASLVCAPVLEFLEGMFLRCPRHVRVMGYLDEIVAIGSRFRRVRDDWAPHLERSKNVVRQAIALCEPRRTAVIFGSGRLLDVPLPELAAAFERVVLVDIVHVGEARRTRRSFANVELAALDVTGISEAVYHLGPTGGPLPISQPTVFLDDPQVDLAASMNLVSQLPYTPGKYLRRWQHYSAADLDKFARHLIEAHLAFLGRFTCTVCLIADQEYLTYDAADRLVETRGALQGIALPWPGEAWLWHLAPRSERGATSLVHRVRGAIRGRLSLHIS